MGSVREITEAEAFALAGDADCPVLCKEESESMEAAVCLKRFPQGYVLGASDKVRDLRIWLVADLVEARRMYDDFVAAMRASGTPFGTPRGG